MGKASRDKGKRGEAQLEHAFQVAGLDYVREQDGRTQGGDYRIGAVVLDGKHRERIEIRAWSREIEQKTPDHLVPAIAYRSNRDPWRVSMTLADWIELYKAAQA